MKQYITINEVTARIDQLVFDTMKWSGMKKRDAIVRIRTSCPELFIQLASFPLAATNPYLTNYK